MGYQLVLCPICGRQVELDIVRPGRGRREPGTYVGIHTDAGRLCDGVGLTVYPDREPTP